MPVMRHPNLPASQTIAVPAHSVPGHLRTGWQLATEPAETTAVPALPAEPDDTAEPAAEDDGE